MSFSPRQSPFRRPESPAGGRAPTSARAPSPQLTMSPPTKPSSPSTSPERQSPFARRPSQLGAATDGARSPFARAPSRLSVAVTPEPESRANTDPFIVRSPPLRTTGIISPPADLSSRSSPVLSAARSPPLPQSSTASPAAPRPSYTSSSSTTSPVRSTPSTMSLNKPAPSSYASSKPALAAFANAGNYTHVPPALLRSMRESFEVLDTTSSNAVSRTDLVSILEQLGLDASPSSLAAFFPSSSGPSQSLNLARFLDQLCEPMKDLSEREELAAAFAAFDVDDSGQIDVAELRDAVVRTAPVGGDGGRLSEREVDTILRDFTSRRAFGAKGVSGKDVGSRGEVFKYRDFMASIQGSGHDHEQPAAVA